MTFVIRDNSQNNDNYLDPNYLFDKEQYNFLINRRTCFTCDSMVGRNFEKLSYILHKLEQIDPILLDQLNYYYLKEIRDDIDEEDEDQDEALIDLSKPFLSNSKEFEKA